MEQLNLRFDIPLALVSPDELYQNAEQFIELLKEDRRFERKSPRTSPRSLGEYFSMWANTVPDGGLIAVGIEDGGAITGCKCLSQSELNEREQAGRTYCSEARHSSKLVAVTNSKGESDYILLIRVQYRTDKVVYDSQSHAWTRIGDQKHVLSKEECREIEISKGQVDFEQEPIIDLVYPTDFDTVRIAQFAQAFIKSRGLSYNQSDEQVLVMRHLGKFDAGRFIPNVACVLLFAKDPTGKFPGCRVRFRRFEGEQEQTGANYNAVKDYWVEGNLAAIIERTSQILESQIREFSRLGPDGHFRPDPE